MAATLLMISGAYLLGSVSFAVVVSRLFALPDPHTYGSRSPGATNVLRTGRRGAAALTLVGDALKGFVAVAIVAWLVPRTGAAPWTPAAAGALVFVGHLFPIFHRFAGGKGVATAAGVVFAWHWQLGVALAVIWILVALGFRISSLAALTTALLLPLGMFYVAGPEAAQSWASVAIALLLFWRHRANIRRLLAGNEPQIGH